MGWNESFVALPSGRTRIWSRGEGPPILWTHSLFHPIDVEEHTPLGPALSKIEGRRVIRYDARGQGRSERGPDRDAHRWERLGAEIVALSRHLGLGPLVLGGASMGAVASIFAALEGALDVRALALVIPPTAWSTRPRQAQMYRAMAKLIERAGMPALIRTFEQYLTDKTAVPGFEGAREHVLTNLKSFEPRTLLDILEAHAASDLPPPERLDALDMPALIVAVNDDQGHPRSTAETLAEHLAGAELEVHPRITSEGLSRSLRRFLDEIEL